MQVQNFGEPFFLVIHQRETLAELKIRIQKKFQVADDEFHKWKFAFMSMSQSKYLQDSDVPQNYFQGDTGGDWEQYLGLEHLETAPKFSHNQVEHKYLQVDVRETLNHSETKVEPTIAPRLVTAAEKLKDPKFKKKRKDADPSSGSSSPLKKFAKTPPLVRPRLNSPPDPVTTRVPVSLVPSNAAPSCSGGVVSSIEPISLVQGKECIDQAIRLLEPHMAEDFVRIDNQDPNVIVGQVLKAGLEKFTIQLDSQSKKLEDFQVANTSLSVAKVEAEEALKAAVEKVNVAEAKAATLKAELQKLQAEKLSWEDKMKAKENDPIQKNELSLGI